MPYAIHREPGHFIRRKYHIYYSPTESEHILTYNEYMKCGCKPDIQEQEREIVIVHRR